MRWNPLLCWPMVLRHGQAALPCVLAVLSGCATGERPSLPKVPDLPSVPAVVKVQPVTKESAVTDRVGQAAITPLSDLNVVQQDIPVALLKAMLKNPILMACLIGLLLNFAGVPPFPVLARILDLLGGAALPLGLIVAGAGLSFAEVMRRRVTVLWVSGVKLMVMPFLMWGVCRLLGGDQLAQALALLCGATPGASVT